MFLPYRFSVMRRFKRKSYSCAFFISGEGQISFSILILEARKMYITKYFRMVIHARDPTALDTGNKCKPELTTKNHKNTRRSRKMFNLENARTSHFMPLMTVFALSTLRLFGFQMQGNIFAMSFFSSAIDGLKTVITAIGAGIGVWD